MSSACARAWRLGSWDRFTIPRPFSRVVVAVGEPLVVPENVPLEDLEPTRLALERELGRLAILAEDRAESLARRPRRSAKEVGA